MHLSLPLYCVLFINAPSFSMEKFLDWQNSITSCSDRCSLAATFGISEAISAGTVTIPC